MPHLIDLIAAHLAGLGALGFPLVGKWQRVSGWLVEFTVFLRESRMKEAKIGNSIGFSRAFFLPTHSLSLAGKFLPKDSESQSVALLQLSEADG